VNVRFGGAGAFLRAGPLVALIAFASIPLVLLTIQGAAEATIDVSSLGPSLRFAAMGAFVAVVVGGLSGAIAGTLEVPGRRWATAIATVLIAAPPAYWWIGVTRLPGRFGSLSGVWGGSVVAGMALAPVTLLLVLAAAREIPSNVYQAARLSLDPVRRFRFILLPLLRPALSAGFLLTLILLLGESEIPFLFGFRTSMTDIVTIFSETFEPGRTAPLVMPLLGTVIVLGAMMAKALFAVLLAAPASGRGVIRRRAGRAMAVGLLPLPALAALSLIGYGWASASNGAIPWARIQAGMGTTAASIAEPILCAVAGVALVMTAAYPIRRSFSIRPLMAISLLLFCVPAGIVAIGWIAVAQAMGGSSIAPAVAHVSRAIALPGLGFLVTYSRMAPSLDDAARLVPVSARRRAWTFILPLLAPSIAAASAMTAALIFADRDIASLLLAPGQSRLMLSLYLLSANAPSAAIGAAALVVFAAGAAVISAAGLLPFVLLRGRRG
jgi:iron(III) transport system permease protein